MHIVFSITALIQILRALTARLELEALLPYQDVAQSAVYIGIIITTFAFWKEMDAHDPKEKPSDPIQVETKETNMGFLQKYKYVIFSILLTVPTATEGYKYFNGETTEKTFLIAAALLTFNIFQALDQKKAE